MRKFLCDYSSVWDEKQLRDFFANESDDREYMTFEQWLAECMGKNGALTEILTAETPNENRKNAVIPCRVYYFEDDYCYEWLTEERMREKSGMGLKCCRLD